MPEETPEFLGLAARSMVIAGVVGWAELTSAGGRRPAGCDRTLPGGAGSSASATWSRPRPIRGGCPHRRARGPAAVGSAGLVFDLLVTADQLPAAVDVAGPCPRSGSCSTTARNPASHGANSIRGATASADLAALPNVAVKLSGLLTEAARTGRSTNSALRRVPARVFGADRTMYGSDWPVSVLRASYGAVSTRPPRWPGRRPTSEQP